MAEPVFDWTLADESGASGVTLQAVLHIQVPNDPIARERFQQAVGAFIEGLAEVGARDVSATLQQISDVESISADAPELQPTRITPRTPVGA